MSRSGDEAFREIQALARREARGNTQTILEQFVHERFLARLAVSRFAESFVLKGGMLLAVMNLRRATRDADVMVRDFPMDADALRTAFQEVLADDLEDGVVFDAGTITVEEIREEAQYAGLRFALNAHVGAANMKLKIDVSTGDPVEPISVKLPTLLDDDPISLNGYPIECIIAEKAETVIARGDANTRMRDFADLYLITKRHTIEADALRAALTATADHRGNELIPVETALVDFIALRQVDWARYLDQAQLDAEVPQDLQEVVDAIVGFVDPALDASTVGMIWNPKSASWSSHER